MTPTESKFAGRAATAVLVLSRWSSSAAADDGIASLKDSGAQAGAGVELTAEQSALAFA